MDKNIKINTPNFGRYVGGATQEFQYQNYYFNDGMVCNIQNYLAEALRPYEKEKRKVIVSKEIIITVMQKIISDRIPTVGNIYTHTVMPTLSNTDTMDVVNRTIQVIYTNLKNEMEMEMTNSKLSVWSTLYGEFNKEGLRSHPPVKIRKNKPQSMLFNMNY